jgi:hypothetical protein
MKRCDLILAVIAFAALPTLSGCGIGYNKTLFITKTNAGLDASAEPPTLELNVSRIEGVVAPQFANGKKLPVMASFRFKNSDIFAPSVGSAFATGDAATTMSALYADTTPLNDWQTRANTVKGSTLPTDSSLVLDSEPTISGWLPSWLSWLEVIIPKPEFQKNDVRPVFFGTDTSLGLKVAWSGMTGGFPDSAKFGYNRKELALVPIAMELKDSKYRMKMSSLLATVDLGVDGLKNPDGTPALGYQHIQYFATGDAATLLALQQDVRLAMLARLDPNKELLKARFGTHLEGKSKAVAFVLLNHIYAELRNLEKEKGDQMAKSLADRMDALVPSGLTIDFKNYTYLSGNLDDSQLWNQLSGKSFRSVNDYYTKLDQTIRNLQAALADEGLKQSNGKDIKTEDKTEFRKALIKEIDDLQKKKRDFEALIQRDDKVLSDAASYFFN